ncbi:molybdopterin molybdotransferase MoeA [Pseudomonas sp. Marseille-QA0892]
MANGLISLEEALGRLLDLAAASPLLEEDMVSLAEADGRVLAESLTAGLDLPPWDNSAMDGYAVRLADIGDTPLPVSQRIMAGSAPVKLQPGTCARIFTGAPIPEGADAVEMQENCIVEADGCVRFLQAVRPRQNIRPQGQETRTGDRVLEAGARLGPVEIGLVASLGIASLKVIKRPRVAVVSTGDELVEPGAQLAPGQIYNSNRHLLGAWLKRLGCEVIDAGILPDDLDLTRKALADLGQADLILSTGGVSVGEADFLGLALREAGELAFWKLAIKPGKPLTCGHYRGTPVIGLPGNPASTLVTFGLLARPYLLRRLGCSRVDPLAFEVPAGFDWPKAGGRREFLRARLENGKAVPYQNQSSGVLLSASWADGLAEVREGTAPRSGERIRFIPFSELMN